MSQDDANDFLMGGGGKSASFDGVAPITVRGKIKTKPVKTQQRDITSSELKFWPNGDPMMQVVVPLQTDERDPSDPQDDGTRVLYISGAKQTAVRDAVRKAGATGLEVGGELTVTYTGDDMTKEVKRGMNRPKLYSASYVPPNPLDADPNDAWSTQSTPAAAQAAPAGLVYQRPDSVPEAVWATLPDSSKAAFVAAQNTDAPPF